MTAAKEGVRQFITTIKAEAGLSAALAKGAEPCPRQSTIIMSGVHARLQPKPAGGTRSSLRIEALDYTAFDRYD
jgi:hypothetical protein